MSKTRTSDGLFHILIVIVAALLLLPFLMMAFAMPMLGMMGWWWDGGMHGVSPLWGIGMALIPLVVLVVVGYGLYRAFADGIPLETETDPALEELRKAYARGDLTDEEFEQRRETLRSRE